MRPYSFKFRSLRPFAAGFLAALALAGCGGGSSSSSSPGAAQTSGGRTIAVGEPVPNAPARDQFIVRARAADCAEQRNRLFVIDNGLVVWDRAGNCPDMAWNVTLYGQTPDAMLCTAGDSMGGTVTQCKDERYREMLATIVANLQQPDLGLGASHKVDPVPFDVRMDPLVLQPLLLDDYSGITAAQNVVIRDAAEFQKVWNAHYLGRSPVPALPQVDFTKKMVVGVFTGASQVGCKSVALTGAAKANGRLVVEYEINHLMTVAPCTQYDVAPMALSVVDRVEGDVSFVDITPRALAFTSLDLDWNSAIRSEETVVVRDAQAWAALWARHRSNVEPKPPVPDVDFQRYMVIGLFAGEKPNGCHATTISSVYLSGGMLHVARLDRTPSPDEPCATSITAPAHLIMLERSDVPLVFTLNKVS